MIVVSSLAQAFIPHHRGKWVYQLLSPIPVASAPVHGRLAASDSHLVPAHAHTHAHNFNNHFQVKVLIKCSTEFIYSTCSEHKKFSCPLNLISPHPCLRTMDLIY